jgi:transcriptional regulator with XRE-family HTH domain
MKTWDDMIKGMDPDSQREIEVIRQRAAMVAQLVAIREEKGWTQERLAKEAGMKQSAIARFEGDSTVPRIDTIIKVTIALKVKMIFMPEGMEEAAASSASTTHEIFS